MRRAIFITMFLSLAMGAFAQNGGPMGRNDVIAADLEKEVEAILDQKGGVQLGVMTVGDWEDMAGRVSIAIQKARYVRQAKMASMALPGAGQFMTGDALGGTLYILGDLAVAAGTLVGSYFLLPANVRFDSLDYLNTPHSAIKTVWESNTVMDYLPSIGVAAGGMAATMILRWLSSTNAEAGARGNIESGKVTFQPMLLPSFGSRESAGGMGFGFRLCW